MIFYGISKGSNFFFACGLISGGLAKRDFSPTMGAHGTMSKGLDKDPLSENFAYARFRLKIFYL